MFHQEQGRDNAPRGIRFFAKFWSKSDSKMESNWNRKNIDILLEPSYTNLA